MVPAYAPGSCDRLSPLYGDPLRSAQASRSPATGDAREFEDLMRSGWPRFS
jgi:hypothetical protein